MSDAPESQSRRLALESFYAPLESSDNPARRVGWESADIQSWRHDVLLETLEPLSTIQSVLDVGSGEGALLSKLRAAGFRGHYRGEDLRPNPIANAKTTLLGVAGARPAEFVCVDSLSEVSPLADVVICSGTFNTLQPEEDHDAFMAQALEHLYARARLALVLDVAVLGRHQGGVGIALTNLEALYQHARTLSSMVSISERGIPGEAVVVLAKTRAFSLRRLRVLAPTRAKLALDTGEIELAEEVITQLEPTASRSFLQARLHLAKGELDEAFALLNTLRQHPKLGLEASLLLTPLYFRKGHKDEAEAVLVALAPQHDEAAAHLCQLRLARGNLEGAKAALELIKDKWMQRELEAYFEAP